MMGHSIRFLLITCISLTAIITLAANCASAGSSNAQSQSRAQKFKGVHSTVVVNSDQKTVYEAICSLKDAPDSGVKEIESGTNYAVLEEVFDGLPIIDKSVCRYKEIYTPYQRIEYHMIKSDKFKAFEGSWEITPAKDGCIVQLSSYIDPGLPIPFVVQITNTQTLHDIKTRLAELKKSIETRSNIATKGQQAVH